MKYRVIWNSTAKQSAQRIYQAALDKEAVQHAIVRVNLELSARPSEAGESREEETRVLFKHPLVVWFHVNERLKNVLVFQVRSLRP